MSHKKLSALIGCALLSIQWMIPPSASAVGGGIGFVFREGFVPNGMNHPVPADSMDFSYHACVDFTAAGQFTETGYLWISSFQDVAGVVDSQINYFAGANGYHLYAKYTYQADQCGSGQTCNGLSRLDYTVEQASLSLFLDPMLDTALAIQGCGVGIANNGDDVFLGNANVIQSGQKSETDDQAHGDFNIVFANWAFSNAGQVLFRDGNGNPLFAPNLVFNGNVTLLGGPLSMDHHPEGSGNLYWRD